ncbi:MAG: amino acid ABC transporter permease [Ndongobacter sp.]|nr:amino acid ABC transporter permease [Ndongobacter sp.]
MNEWFQGLIEAFRLNFIVSDRWHYLLNGLGVTVSVTLVALLIGLVGGMLLALSRVAYRDLQPSWKTPRGFILHIAYRFARLYITVVRGTPSTVQLLIMFNIVLINIDNLMLVAMLTFGLNSAAYMSEIFRGGIQAVSIGEKEAARSLGLNYLQMMKNVVMPQALKNSLPALGNEVITLFKETSICGFIGLADLTRGAGIIISQTFQAIPPYMAVALIYLAVVLLLEQLFRKLEKGGSHA